ncbi:Protein of unknown function DUF2358 [Ostreococcus tauri]|uniref:Uncharacterized protein n=1 Tax=Ostreococcus tauri TaxID=70448 RepID=Q00YK5_OSTTA|nr:Protein of unknown function DUF2358 [Ostreococcus tauri]CAL55904.1 Protein of unknown function DUF2358 [Ostreococcus tauri]|eukprot:XP_003082101.1 Protein of unknown function DUF2358 [Ostreococcus tauri]
MRVHVVSRLAARASTRRSSEEGARVDRHRQPRRLGIHHESSSIASPRRDGRRITRVQATDKEFRASVDGFREPCDEFVCKSSPAVENTLKSVVKDINAARGTTRSSKPYAPDVEYDDGVLKFKGSEKYAKYCSYVENNLRQVTTRVTEISMKDTLDVATVRWELNGTNDIGRVGVDIEATYKMNLITGRVLEHRERWTVNPSRTEAQAGALLESTRKAHALPLNAMELADRASQGLKELTKSFSSGDEGEKNIYVNPNDPMKFFQQDDTSKTDLLQLSLVAAVIYLLTKVFEVLN